LAEGDPCYSFDELKLDCLRKPEIINLYLDVLDDAFRDFKIRGRCELLALIGNDEFDKRRFNIKTVHDKNPKLFIDSYLFEINRKEGYLAFFKRNNKWTIKSFHESAFQIGDISKSPKMLDTLKALGYGKNFKIGGPSG
jgi:hypothetical protein